jgi:hypothetical protein
VVLAALQIAATAAAPRTTDPQGLPAGPVYSYADRLQSTHALTVYVDVDRVRVTLSRQAEHATGHHRDHGHHPRPSVSFCIATVAGRLNGKVNVLIEGEWDTALTATVS